jgi:hypothetical protein
MKQGSKETQRRNISKKIEKLSPGKYVINTGTKQTS